MKLFYINYSDINYRKHQNDLIDLVNDGSIFDGSEPYTREWLEGTDFYKENKSLLDRDRLAGYALWKPYIILDKLNKIDDGDVVVYMDCGDIPLQGTRECLLDHMNQYDQYFMAGNHTCVNKWWTKRDCFHYMGCDEEKYWNAIQLEDGFLAFKKTEFNLKFVSEWLEWCKDERCVSDIPNQCGMSNYEGFKDHRHDQSIITLLQIKYNLPPVMGHTKMRLYTKGNVLHHKDGDQWSNGSYNWDATGNYGSEYEVENDESHEVYSNVDYSIELTVHNKGWLLPRVLDGIKQNTTGSYELIIVLDGCTDNSEEVVDDFVSNNRNIKVKVLHTPNVFETKANNVGLREAEGERLIIVQDDMVIKEKGWNERMNLPFENFIDVFGVTSRAAFNYRLNRNSRCLTLPREEDLKLDNDWSDIFTHQSHICRDEGLSRNIFAIRNSVCRGPLMLDHEDMWNLNYFDEIFEPQDQDDADLCYRAWKKLNKVVGAYWIDYESDRSWGSTRPDGWNPAPWLFKAHHKNTRIVWERHQDIIMNESHDENRVLK